MDSVIEMIESYEMVYMRKMGPYGSGNVQIMEKLKAWVGSNDLLNEETIILGIAQDNPAITRAEDCRYDACLVISSGDKIVHKDILQGDIAGGRYVVFRVQHREAAVQKAWANLFGELMKKHYVLDDTRPIIERYKSQMVKEHLCEICVPIY